MFTDTFSSQRYYPLSLDDEEIFSSHLGGKISTELTIPIESPRGLAIAYTPGVAQVSRAIAADSRLVDHYSWAGRLVAIVSDGTAVLGLGNIGPHAALPVLEGKAALFRQFAGLNAIPIVLDTHDPDEIVETLVRMRPSFGAVNLEDIAAPRCFEIERRLIDVLDCPVMHDDQHGTAVVILAALRGACRVLDREMSSLKVVIFGAGAAGIACAKMLLCAGITNIIVLDSQGILSVGRDQMTAEKTQIAHQTNPEGLTGTLAHAIEGADVFIGTSGAQVSEELIATMAPEAIIFALSNPDPEIAPDIAARYGAIVATGRSDFPNQINNLLAFPGIFRGALDAGGASITMPMLLAASEAIFSVARQELDVDHIVPSALDPRVEPAVAAAVAAAAQN